MNFVYVVQILFCCSTVFTSQMFVAWETFHLSVYLQEITHRLVDYGLSSEFFLPKAVQIEGICIKSFYVQMFGTILSR